MISLQVLVLATLLASSEPAAQDAAPKRPAAKAAAAAAAEAAEAAAAATGAAAAAGGARHAPPAGKILHFHGNPYGPIVDHDYSRALAPDAVPIGESIWLDVPGTRDFTKQRARLERMFAKLANTGRMLNLAIAFDDGTVDGFGTAQDAVYADTAAYDAIVSEIAAMVARRGVPTLLRIGGEVNGEWEGHHPYTFPRAYRKMVGQFIAAGATNVDFVFCIESHGDVDVFEVDAEGNPKWYPGDEFVDWLGVDLFPVASFRDPTAAHRVATRARVGKLSGVVESVMRHARATGKPVFVGECSPYPHLVRDAKSDPNGEIAKQVWRDWFEPFVAWLDAHPEVQGVTFCPVEWTVYPPFTDWGDARVERNPRLLESWREELSKDRWIHGAAVRSDD